MSSAAREAGVVPRRIHLVVAIDRLLVRLVQAAPGQWVVKGGYANQLRRPGDARFTEDLDLKIDAAIETAPELLAAGFAIDLDDDFRDEVATSPTSLEGPPGGGLRFVVVARLAGTELVRFKVDVSAADVVVGDFESCFSDPVLERLGFRRSRFPVYPVNQHVAEKLHALTLPRDVENTRARDLVDLVWFVHHFTFRSEALAIACIATLERRGTHIGSGPRLYSCSARCRRRSWATLAMRGCHGECQLASRAMASAALPDSGPSDEGAVTVRRLFVSCPAPFH